MIKIKKNKLHKKGIELNNKVYAACIVLFLLLAFSIFYIKGSVNLTGNAVDETGPSRSDAFNALMEAEKDMQDMSSLNLSVAFVNDTLRVAKRHFVGSKIPDLRADIEKELNEERRLYLDELIDFAKALPTFEIEKLNYSAVLESTNVVRQRKMQAYTLVDTIALAEDTIDSYSKSRMDVSKGILILDKAKKSFQEERYDEAASLIKEANMELEKSSTESKRAKEIIRLGKNFFARYWWQLLLAVAAIAAASIFLVKKLMARRTQNKIKGLNNELGTLQDLIKKAQEDRFNKKILAGNSYRAKIAKYYERIAEIKHTLPVLEAMQENKKLFGKVSSKETKKEVVGVLNIKK